MLHYLVSMADAKGHYFDVQFQMELATQWIETDGHERFVEFRLPTWIPGSYLIREFSRNVLWAQFQVNGSPTSCTKTSKNCWRVGIDSALAGEESGALVQGHWRVYAWDLSVRGAHLDETHGFFNGTSLFLLPKGCEHTAIELVIERPVLGTGHEDWLVACGLPFPANTMLNPHGCPVLPPGGRVVLHAENHDALIDHPVEMGRLQTAVFNAHGTEHVFAVYGADSDLDLQRLCDDLKPVCEAQIALFEPQAKQAPFSRYWFILHATDQGYGGLEHRNSTALLCSTQDLPQRGVEKPPKGYDTLLGLCSHEYFHSWNVKRMKPAAFTPYALDAESYTRLLWIFEGFTSYYDDLMLARAGRLSETAYLKALGKTVAQVMKGPGHQNQSVSESSFEAWTKYYRQDENAPNAIVSYYTKGALVAFCLDSTIRKQTQGAKSLDDVMRLMWQQKGLTGEGLQEDEFPALIEQATGLNLSSAIAQWTQSTDPLPLETCLAHFGYALKQASNEQAVYFGMVGTFKPEGLCVKQVINGGPAHQAGISAGDVLVAINSKRLTETQHQRALQGAQIGETLNLIGFRADRLMHFELVAAAPRTNEWEIERIKNATAEEPGAGALPAPWLSLNMPS
jgi:predicted metalloprotease with PDZ domain